MDIEISFSSDEGYAPLISSGGWRVSVVNSCERLLEENLVKSERHLFTDEAFVLLRGGAVLFIGKERLRYELEPCKTYNVKAGCFHSLALLADSCVLIVENDDTSAENSEYYYFKEG